MNVESGFQLSDLWGIVRRRRAVVLAVAGCVGLAAYWLAMALPNQYQSSATVLVEPQSVSPDLVRSGVRESDLNERLHLMTAQILSRPRLSRIIDDLDLYRDESQDMLREEVIELMRSKITVEPVVPELERSTGLRRRETEINTFELTFRDDDPVVAQAVTQRLANDFIERHIDERVTVSQKSLEFIAEELERIASRMQQIERRVAEIKEANPGRLPEDLASNQRRLERLTSELARAQRELDGARSDQAFWKAQIATAQEAYRPLDDASPARRAKILELLLLELEARGLTDKHPDVIKARQELAALRRATEEEEAEADANAPALSDAQHQAAAQARRAQAHGAAAQEEIARLRSSIEEVQTLLAETPAVAEQLDGLQREYESQFNSYQDYIVRQQEASVQAGLERRQLGEQFRVLESAYVPTAPTSPNRPFIIAIGLMLGVAFGGGVAMALEVADTSVHSAQQLQSSVGIPVLASIPTIWLESDRARLRRARVRTALASAALAGFALVGGAANYVWVNGAPGFLAALMGEEEGAAEGEAGGAAPGSSEARSATVSRGEGG